MACEVFSPGIWWIGLRVNLSGSWIQFGDGFVWFEAAKGLESPSEVVGCDEVRQVRVELFVGVIEEAFDGGFFDGPVHRERYLNPICYGIRGSGFCKQSSRAV